MHKLLLVDDNKEDRFLMRQALSDAGVDCEIEEVTDGEEAESCLLQKFTSGELPQFVILDMMLPKRSGMEVMENLFSRGVTEATRIIVLSSVLPDGELAQLQKLGAWRVFQKPMDLDEFLTLGERMKDLLARNPAFTPAG